MLGRNFRFDRRCHMPIARSSHPGPGTIAVRYALFALAATAANLGAQRAVLALWNHPLSFFMAMVVGTAVGLAVKYVLDKRWIFYDQAVGLKANSRKFALYTVMGIGTTAIFFAFETAAWLIGGTDFARECGAVTGLAIGYATKYILDRKYVFSQSAHAECSA